MKFPKDWDRPSEANAARCSLFKKDIFEGKRATLPYRYFVPSGANGPLPLVLYLHGADGFGTDNGIHLSVHDIGTFLADSAIQKEHPCYILAPQTSGTRHWSVPAVRETVIDLTQRFILSHNVDKERVYVYGYSAGGAGTLGLLKEYPDFFAAAISICGATSGNNIDNIVRTPLYMVHALDDIIVQPVYGNSRTLKGKFSHYGSKDIWSEFHGTEGFDLRYDEYPAGWMKEHYDVNPHCTWVIVSDPKRNKSIIKWLFSHRRSKS